VQKYAQSFAACWNALSQQWPEMQIRCMALLEMMFTWQLTHDAYEPSRGPNHTAKRGAPRISVAESAFIATNGVVMPQVIQGPRLDGRYTTDRPLFVPFRVWDAKAVSESHSETAWRTQRQGDRDRRDEWLKKLADEEFERKIKRMKEMEERLKQLQEDWQRAHVPNPADPWDYRNWTETEYRDKFLKRNWDQEFFLRAADVPDEITAGAKLLHTGAKLAAMNLKKGAAGLIQEDLDVPHSQFMLAIPIPAIKRVLKKIIKEVAQEYVEDQVEDFAADQVDSVLREWLPDDRRYSPRQVWPEGTVIP
jgi:hypothetical protein